MRGERVHVQWTGEHYEVCRQRPDGVSEVLARCPHLPEGGGVTVGLYVVHDEVEDVFEVRLRRPSGGFVPVSRHADRGEAMVAAGWREPRALVRLPASASLRRLGRRFIGRG